MSEFDNTAVLYDEDGNEIELEIVHFCEFKGETYYVLWKEDDEDENIFLVTKKMLMVITRLYTMMKS